MEIEVDFHEANKAVAPWPPTYLGPFSGAIYCCSVFQSKKIQPQLTRTALSFHSDFPSVTLSLISGGTELAKNILEKYKGEAKLKIHLVWVERNLFLWLAHVMPSGHSKTAPTLTSDCHRVTKLLNPPQGPRPRFYFLLRPGACLGLLPESTLLWMINSTVRYILVGPRIAMKWLFSEYGYNAGIHIYEAPPGTEWSLGWVNKGRAWTSLGILNPNLAFPVIMKAYYWKKEERHIYLLVH